jgi:hypothetical protein
MAGGWKGPVIVMGAARCLFDDMSNLSIKGDVMSVNIAGLVCPLNRRHWVSFHPDNLKHLVPLTRDDPTQKDHIFTHSIKDAEIVWDFDDPELGNGTSGLLATLVALVLGYNPVILAGIPLDGSGNYNDIPGYRSVDWVSGSCHDKWLEYRPLFINRVFSMSGFTREILGAPAGV